MTFPIMGGGFNALAPVFPVQRSVRMRYSGSAYFNRTPAAAGDRRTWTYSVWLKRGTLDTGATQNLLAGLFGGNSDRLVFNQTTNTLTMYWDDAIAGQLTTTQVLRDPSAWYHIVFASDTTQATASNRGRMYINGVQVSSFSTASYPVQNRDGGINNNTVQRIGAPAQIVSQFFDGYLAEAYFIDGYPTVGGTTYSATTWAALNVATLFGSYNIGTGAWQPIRYGGSYGANGYYLNFQDNSGQTTSSNVGIGKDSSGNGNYWVSNGITLTPTTSVSYDSMLDVPTLNSSTNSNFAVLNPLLNTNIGSGNLQVTGSGAGEFHVSTLALPTTGKWYCEMSSTAYNASTIVGWFGVTNSLGTNFSGLLSRVTGAGGGFFQNDVAILSTNIGALNTIVGVAVDRGANTVSIYLNNVLQATAPTMATGVDLFLSYGTYTSGTGWVNFGQRPFSYTPPTGFNCLCTYNLPTPTIPNGAAYFAATTYTGNGTSQSVVNTTSNPLVAPYSNNPNAVAMQPDLVWLKQRSPTGTGHIWEDSVRGVLQYIGSEVSSAESSLAGSVTSFDSSGFSIGSQGGTNASSALQVAWQWKASNATAVTNTNGSISSQVKASTTAGFSIVTYTGTAANATVGHGLGATPKMIIVKNLDSGAIGGAVYHASLGATKYLQLFQTTTGNAAETVDNTAWNGGSPTFNTTVFSVGTLNRTNSAQRMVAYCWAEVSGFSKFGSYTGSTSLPFIYLGFRPRFVMVKRTDTAGYDWKMYDTSRDIYNLVNHELEANLPAIETTAGSTLDINSNGFKLRDSTAGINAAGGTYIYAAFAENPFNYSLAR